MTSRDKDSLLGNKGRIRLLMFVNSRSANILAQMPRNRIENTGNHWVVGARQGTNRPHEESGIIPVPTDAWIYRGRAYKGTQAEIRFIYPILLESGVPATRGSMPESLNSFFREGNSDT